MSDVQLYKSALVGANPNLNSDAIKGLFRKTYSIALLNLVAANSILDSPFEHVRRAGQVVNVTLTAPINVAANGTNNVTIVLSKRTGGGGQAIIFQLTTTATTLTNFVPFTVPTAFFTQVNTALAAGDLLSITVTQNAAGVALTAANSMFLLSLDVEEN